MSNDNKPHFSELVWEGDENNMAVPSPEDNRREEARRAAEADKNRNRAEKGRTRPDSPKQLQLWEWELFEARDSLGDKRQSRVDRPGAERETAAPERKSGPAVEPSAAIPRRQSANGQNARRTEERISAGSGGSGRDGDAASASWTATTESLFVERAKETVDLTEPFAEFVKFKSYWPTYGHMTGPQSKWYFHWRGEVRQGRYPETDLSYIFLHVYELINGVGWETPVDGYEQLCQLWEAYRGAFKRLDHYLGGWIADFSFVHGLNIPLKDIVVRAKGLGGDLAELELVRCLTGAPEQLTLSALSLMSDYDIGKSKFCSGQGAELLERFIPRVVALVDAYAWRKHGQRLLDMYPPGPPAMRERYLFRSAVYDISLYGYSVLVPVVRISKSPPLRSLITRLFRLTENKLRALTGFRGRLKGIAIEPGIDELVSAFLEREFRKTEREERKVDIVIDKNRLERLRGDSEVVRRMLTVDEPEGQQGNEPIEDSPSIEQQQPETPSALGGCGIAELEPQDVQGTEREDENLNDAAADGGTSNQGLTGNGTSSLHSFQAAAGTAPASGNPLTPSSISSSEREWEDLATALSPLQREALLALAGPEGADGLRKLADAHQALPDLLIDEINEIAMELLGDLLIDGEELLPEYASMLHYLKR